MNTSIYRYITAIFISFIILSCRGTTDNTGTEGQVVVKINLLGIIETQDAPVSRVRAISAAYIVEVAYNKDFNLVATIVPEVPVLKINSRKSLNPSALTVTPQPPTTRPIDANVKYLVMVFDENGSRITAQEKIYDSTNQSNTANQMILDAGKNYTFVAISYNTATAPTFNAAATTLNNVINTVAVGNTTDYLYFNSGPVNIVYGQQNYINITFKHVNSNVSLSIDATAELGRITSIIAHIEGTGSVNLAANGTGTPGTAAVYDKAFTFPIINTQIVNSSPVLVSSAGSSHTINLVSVSLNGGERRADIPPIVIPAGTFRRGVNYKVKLSFQSTGIIAGGLIWARGNLAYDWGNKIYYNRYYPQESGSDYKDTDYWNYATDDTNPLAPKMIITSHSDIWNWSTNVYYFTDGTNENSDSKIPLNDPCKLVAGGKWRMPSLDDFENLGVYKIHNGGDINGITDGQSATVLGGGVSHANGNITDNNFPYVYFEGIKEMTGISTRLRFYKTGRYYGNVTEADRLAGYQNGGNTAYIPNAVIYMARDAYNYELLPAHRRPYMAVVYSGDRSSGINTFLTQRKSFYHDWSADDRVPIRCVKSP
ncbi:hypothetical protein BAS09_16495 [Elizabethkingia ursingii]|uniref:hypothetical protein n=1 Tax=Elizabethkingia ursingii TaxID=1756150 RepID=UPI00099AEE90|nr:hypothetical protein [Elizabethkingia ursingii]OPC00284.1 hypothetical protein BAS09_16495 [Elizabethkingia ursingii]